MKYFCIDLKKIYLLHNNFTSKRKIYFQYQHVEQHYNELFTNDVHLNDKTTTTKHEISTNNDEHMH